MIRFTDKIKLYFVLKESLAYSSLKNSQKKIPELSTYHKKKKKECTNYSNMTRRAVELNLHKQRLIIFFMEKK